MSLMACRSLRAGVYLWGDSKSLNLCVSVGFFLLRMTTHSPPPIKNLNRLEQIKGKKKKEFISSPREKVQEYLGSGKSESRGSHHRAPESLSICLHFPLLASSSGAHFTQVPSGFRLTPSVLHVQQKGAIPPVPESSEPR